MALELSRKAILVFLCHLLGGSACGVVELLKHVLLYLFVRQSSASQCVSHSLAKGFGGGEEDASILHGVALHKVELGIRAHLVVGIQTVAAHHLDERFLGSRCGREGLGQVVQIHACRVALILHIQTELCFLHRRGKVIHVLHHQSPVGHLRTVVGVLQCLDKECLGGVGVVGGKLTHLIGLSVIGVFVCHGKHLIGLQSRFEREIAQRLVQRIF